MKRAELLFERPAGLEARRPPEARGLPRDGVRLLVTLPEGHRHARFHALDHFLDPGDLLVVNESATLAASLPAEAAFGAFLLNLSTRFGPRLWLAEPRWSPSRPGPLPLAPGDRICLAGRMQARMVGPAPGQPRLWFVRLAGEAEALMDCCGSPIRYGYVEEAVGWEAYRTLFARQPGSAEMPSAARPFSPRVLERLHRRGVKLSAILLHTGVSSLEVEAEDLADHPMQAEPFSVSAETAAAVNATRAAGRRVIAVGTTVVRALESAWDEDSGAVLAARGFSRRFVHPAAGPRVVYGLLTGLHDPVTSHLALLYALAGEARIREAYAEALRAGYLWHEFGDSHLILAEAVPRARFESALLMPSRPGNRSCNRTAFDRE